MDWKVAFAFAFTFPWIISLGFVPLTGRWQARRWAGNTGLVLDDIRGPMVVTELKNNAVFRRVGGTLGTMAAYQLAFGGRGDSSSRITAAYGLLLGGYGLGVMVAHAVRRLPRSSLPSASRYSDADLHETRYEPAIDGPSRIGAFVLVGTGVAATAAVLIAPNGSERWPALVTLVLLPTSLIALAWVESQRLWGPNKAKLDVMASMRTGDIRVLWAICVYFGALATLSGVVSVFRLDNGESSWIPLVTSYGLILPVLAALGTRMSFTPRHAPADRHLHDSNSHAA